MPSGALKDAIPPYHEEAEIATIGALLVNFNQDSLHEIKAFLRASDFYKGAHQLIFNAIKRLDERGEGIDILTLTDELKSTGELDKAGGASYVAALTSQVPTAANVGYYAKIVQETSIRRHLLDAAHKIIAQAHDDSKEIRTIVDEVEQMVLDLIENQTTEEIKTTVEVVNKTMELVRVRLEKKDEFVGIPSGFEGLDKLTNGFQNSELVIIGARPSIGKTALALSMASNIAFRYKIPCAFFTLEMSDVSLMIRIISAESNVSSNKIRTGLMGRKDLQKIMHASDNIYEKPLLIQDTPNIPLMDLRSIARKMVARHEVKIIFIDYIGLISPEDQTVPRYEQISAISRSLKSLARELDIPLVVLSQVGRQTEGKVPTLADLRESGALEQDADLVLFLYRERGLDIDIDANVDNNQIETQLVLAKNRNGPTGVVPLNFIPSYTRFEDRER